MVQFCVLVLIFRGTEYLEEDFRSRSSSLSGVMVSVQTAVRRQQRLQELEDEEKQIQQPQQVCPQNLFFFISKESVYL